MFRTYDIALSTNEDPHVSATPTSTSDVKTITPPSRAKAFFITCETNGCRFTLDGTTPDATSGIPLANGAAPLFVPIGGRAIKVVSQAAGNSVVQVMWME